MGESFSFLNIKRGMKDCRFCKKVTYILLVNTLSFYTFCTAAVDDSSRLWVFLPPNPCWLYTKKIVELKGSSRVRDIY